MRIRPAWQIQPDDIIPSSDPWNKSYGPNRVISVCQSPDNRLTLSTSHGQHETFGFHDRVSFPRREDSGFFEHGTSARAGDLYPGDIVQPPHAVIRDENGTVIPRPDWGSDEYDHEDDFSRDDYESDLRMYEDKVRGYRMAVMDISFRESRRLFAIRFESAPHGKVYTTFVSTPDELIHFPGSEFEFASESMTIAGEKRQSSTHGPYKNIKTDKIAHFIHKKTRGRYPASIPQYDMWGQGMMRKPEATKYKLLPVVHPETGEKMEARFRVNGYPQPLVAEWAHWEPYHDENDSKPFTFHPDDPFRPGDGDRAGASREEYLRRASSGVRQVSDMRNAVQD